MKHTLIIGQSGGPTSVINGSLAGVAAEARAQSSISRALGMRFGIEGLRSGEFADLGALGARALERLRDTPSSALGSSRLKLRPDHFPPLLDALKKVHARYFLLIGGNDSMDTIHRLEQYARDQGYNLIGIGVPKTVDNDLHGTDHTPGFPSAARYTALSVMQGGRLARDMRKVDRFVIYQSVGRTAGWLTASAALARRRSEDAPHILVIPERPLNRERFLARVAETERAYGWVSIACGEGAVWDDGTPVSASVTRDKFNNVEFGAMGGTSVAIQLHRLIGERFPDWRGEFQITESLSMCAADRMSGVDREEAFELGREAVRRAVSGERGVMVGLTRESDAPYRTCFCTTPLAEVAVRAKPLPDEFIGPDGFTVTDKFLGYLRPLVGELPEYVELS